MLPDEVSGLLSPDASWRPLLTGCLSSEVLSECATGSAAGVAVARLTDVTAGQLPMVGSWLVCLPLTTDETDRIPQLSGSADVMLTVDHYVQAERISAVGAGGRDVQSVLILLQGEQPGPGIRPGQDALRLAQGISGLAGIRVAGVSVSIVDESAAESVMAAAVHTQKLFRSAGIDCDLLNVIADAGQLPEFPGLAADFCFRDLVDALDGPCAAGRCVAEVISRPSLDVVVISLESTRPAAERHARFPDHPDARVLRWLNGCCVLAAEGSTQRLTIGDRVCVEYQDDEC